MTDREPRIVAHIAAAPVLDAAGRAALLPELTRRAEARGILLSTCHRVEWIAEADEVGVESAEAAAQPPAADGSTVLEGREAARHVIRLALGLESSVLGEDQVLHQLRGAIAAARARGPIGRHLTRVLDVALRAGRIGRSWRPPLEASLADRAFTVALERGVTQRPGRLLVVGSGEMGQLVAAAGRRRGWAVTVAARDLVRATDALAAERVRVVPFDPGAEAVVATDLVIVALAGPWSIGETTGTALRAAPLVIDLSDPSAVDDAIRRDLGARFVDIDALADQRSTGPEAERYRARLERLAEETLDAYLLDVAERDASLADRLAARIERQRTEALDAYLRERPDLDPGVRADLDDLTRGLSARLFREPLARLARDPDDRRRAALEDLFGW